MAEVIAEGIQESDGSATIKLMNAGKEDKNDIITAVFRSIGDSGWLAHHQSAVPFVHRCFLRDN